jgi:hypothetical protein
MTHPARLAALLLALTPAAAAAAGEMKAEVRLDGANIQAVRGRFGAYGYRPRQTILPEAGGYRFRLPGAGGVGQTGIYSYFALTGDCEVTAAYELIGVPAPPKGYGCGVGLALDAGDQVGRGSVQRLNKAGTEGSGYVVQTELAAADPKEVYRFVPGKGKRGRLGLRRVGKELVFLTADAPDAELEEVDRLPFTERTIRAVRLFADDGGSATAVDVRLKDIAIRAEEITGGLPQKEGGTSAWWWLAAFVPAAGAGLVFWRWRASRDRSDQNGARVAPGRRGRPRKR